MSRIFIDLLNKKKTRATEAKRKGLESLAQWISDGQQGELSQKAEAYINDEVATVDEAIQGALDIIAEHVSDNPKYRSRILKDIYRQGNIVTAKKKKRMMKRNICNVL